MTEEKNKGGHPFSQPPEVREKIRKLWADTNQSGKAIAHTYGISEATVHRYVKGVRRKGQGEVVAWRSKLGEKDFDAAWHYTDNPIVHKWWVDAKHYIEELRK